MPKEKFSLSPSEEEEKLKYLEAITSVAEEEMENTARASGDLPGPKRFFEYENPDAPLPDLTYGDRERIRLANQYDKQEEDFIIAENDEGLIRERLRREKLKEQKIKEKIDALFQKSPEENQDRLATLKLLRKEAGEVYIQAQLQEKKLRDSGANHLLIREAEEVTRHAQEDYLSIIDDMER